jgi:hypothetical protein
LQQIDAIACGEQGAQWTWCLLIFHHRIRLGGFGGSIDFLFELSFQQFGLSIVLRRDFGGSIDLIFDSTSHWFKPSILIRPFVSFISFSFFLTKHVVGVWEIITTCTWSGPNRTGFLINIRRHPLSRKEGDCQRRSLICNTSALWF